jgi:hypothetical protein
MFLVLWELIIGLYLKYVLSSLYRSLDSISDCEDRNSVDNIVKTAMLRADVVYQP